MTDNTLNLLSDIRTLLSDENLNDLKKLDYEVQNIIERIDIILGRKADLLPALAYLAESGSKQDIYEQALIVRQHAHYLARLVMRDIDEAYAESSLL